MEVFAACALRARVFFSCVRRRLRPQGRAHSERIGLHRSHIRCRRPPSTQGSLRINIFNGKKSSIFSMGRYPQYFHWEEILNIFNGKKSLIFSLGRNPQIIFLMGTVANPIGRVTLWFKSYNSVFNIHTHT